MDDNFQFWSSPVLDLSLDSFSTEIFQEFDKSVINNESNSILTNQFIMDSDTPATIKKSTESTAPLNDHGEDFISASPTSSSSVSLQEVEEDDQEEDDEKEDQEEVDQEEVVEGEREEEIMSTADAPVIEDNEEIMDDVPASNHVSRQSSIKSAFSKIESPSDVREDNSDAPCESADNTGVQQEQPILQTAYKPATYTSKEVMSVDPIIITEPVSPAAPKKSLFSCFSFC